MSREIKFRAWVPSQKRITSPQTLDELINRAVKRKQSLQDELIIMQFTGLNDKKGKGIYEGDIIRLRTNFLKNAKKEEPEDYSEHIYTVTFFDGMFAMSRGLPFNNGFVTGGIIEVIGNIYENPELSCN